MKSTKPIKFVTLTNKGYLEYTHNLVNSIIENRIKLELDIFTLDNESQNYFNNMNLESTRIDNSDINFEFKDFQLQNSDNFYKIVYFKFYCINRLLSENNPVMFIDGDIVIKKNFINDIYNLTTDFDLVAQSNKSPHDNNDDEINSGFMLFKPGKTINKLINPDRFSLKKFSKYKFHDQTYINNIKRKFNYKLLDLNLFPNGAHYKKYKNELDPYIIHYNYLIGHEKKNQMIKDNNWYM